MTTLIVGVLLISGGCNSDQKTTTSDAVTLGSVNDHCPVLGFKKVNADAPIRTYHGQTVGFCCDKCPTKWDQWSEEKKAEFVARQAQN